jgi:signal transduction histidine kinase
MTNRTIQTFLQNAIFGYAGVGLAALLVIASGFSFILARAQMASDLQESARATAQAFRDRIIDGDIRMVEPQIRQMLQLREGESAQILKPDFSRVYESFAPADKIHRCLVLGESCFDGYFGQAHIIYPISFDQDGKSPYRYLYLARNVRLNWSFLTTMFIVFTLGYLGLLFAVLRVSKKASGRLGKEIEAWSDRLKDNPKDVTPLARPPFAELLPLKEAIEGLNEKIENYEKKATDKAKLLVLRGIAHDILTPVARLQLYLATLERSIDKDANASVLSEIQDSLNKVTEIASQVKALKEVELNAENSDLVAVTSEEVNALRDSQEISSKAIQIEFKANKSEITTGFSRTEISRILSNLVKNAADASPVGSVVNVEVGSQNGTSFLSVKDRGCGIPEQFKGRIFDPDFTLKQSTGTGLGLAIVKFICDQRSAKINLQSEVARGTTVTISMPIILGGTNV